MSFTTVYVVGGSLDNNTIGNTSEVSLPAHVFGTKEIPYIKGFRMMVPAEKGIFELVHITEQDMDIHWVKVACSGYSDYDNWDLAAQSPTGDIKTICETIYTKELGEVFSVAVLPVLKDTTLKFKFNNISGTSKIIWVDLGFKK